MYYPKEMQRRMIEKCDGQDADWVARYCYDWCVNGDLAHKCLYVSNQPFKYHYIRGHFYDENGEKYL